MNSHDTPPLDYASDILILGIGNLLWADEGFGIRALEALHTQWRFRPGVRLLDGGTQGLYLLPYVKNCRRLLIFDAVDYGLRPGAVKIVQGDEVPAFMGVKKMSLHQTGFQEVLSLARLQGWQPAGVVLIGVQPAVLEDYGGSLSDVVKDKLPVAVESATRFLYTWMARPERRIEPPGPDERITLDSLGLEPYETQRPSAEAACRWGDERFLDTAPEASAAQLQIPPNPPLGKGGILRPEEAGLLPPFSKGARGDSSAAKKETPDMCIGIPMQVIECRGLTALCEARGGRRRLDLALVGEQPPGTWLLAFLDAAREVIGADAARLINAALDGLDAALDGGTDLDRHFADLIGREPQLPEHLRGPRS